MQASPISLINEAQQQQLLQVAKDAICFGFEHSRPWRPKLNDFPGELSQDAASFVTLTKAGQLRGCIGTLEPYQPMVLDVALHAFEAAFRDHRFTPLRQEEVKELNLHVSLLSPTQQLSPGLTDEELMAQLTPLQDGLILQQGQLKAVFLPQVWEQLPNPQEFLLRLKIKGGWSEESPTELMECSTFQVQEFGGEWVNTHHSQ